MATPSISGQVPNPDVVVDVEMADVDLDERRNLGRQRFDFDLVLDRAEDAALLDAGRVPDEVEAYFRLDLLGQRHLDEIDMSEQGPVWMAIDHPDQGRYPDRVIDLEVDEDVEASVGVEGDAEVVVIDGDMLGLGASPVNDRRHLALATETTRSAAAKLAPGGGFEGVPEPWKSLLRNGKSRNCTGNRPPVRRRTLSQL